MTFFTLLIKNNRLHEETELCIRASSMQFQSTLTLKKRICKGENYANTYAVHRFILHEDPEQTFPRIASQRSNVSGLSQATYLVDTGTLSSPSSIIAFELLHYAGQS